MKKGLFDGYKTYDTSEGFGSAKQWRQSFNARMTGEEAEVIIGAQKETPLSILGLTPGATEQAIKSAYRKLMKENHPDLNNNSIASQEKSRLIIAAYEKLKSSFKS